MTKNLLSLMLLALTLLCSACTTYRPRSEVAAYTAPNFSPALVHAVVPSGPAQQGDLEFAELAAEVSSTLSAAGFRVDNTANSPDVAVMIEYGTASPRNETLAQTKAAMARFGTQASKEPSVIQNEKIVRHTDPAGTSTHIYIDVTAVRFNDAGASVLNPLWKLSMEQYWPDQLDLRKMAPYMLAASVPYLGKSTNSLVFADNGDDALVEFIRTGARP